MVSESPSDSTRGKRALTTHLRGTNNASILRVFGTLALLGMLAASVGPANAAQLQLNAGAPYLCAVVAGGNTAPGTPVIQYFCSGGPEDQWSYNVNGFLQGIGTANGEGMCLDAEGGGTTAGGLVVPNPCSLSSNSQNWGIVPSGGAGNDGLPAPQLYGAPGGALITNQANSNSESCIFGFICPPDLCLDSYGGPAVGGGTQLVLNNCTAGASQNWIVRGMQLQVGGIAPYVCANVKGSKTANGTPVLAYSCDDAPNELWNWENGQIYGIGTENGTSKCLTAAAAAAGSLVSLSTCSGGQNQQWDIYGVGTFGGNQYDINLDSNTSLCLDSSGGPSVGGGKQLILNNCNYSATSQNWTVR